MKQQSFPSHPTHIVNFSWEELWTFCVLCSGAASRAAILIPHNKWECELAQARVCSLGLAHPARPGLPALWLPRQQRQSNYSQIIAIWLKAWLWWFPCAPERREGVQALSCGDCDTNERGDGKSTAEKTDSGCSLRVISLYILIMMKWQQLAQQRSKIVCSREEGKQRSCALHQKSYL